MVPQFPLAGLLSRPGPQAAHSVIESFTIRANLCWPSGTPPFPGLRDAGGWGGVASPGQGVLGEHQGQPSALFCPLRTDPSQHLREAPRRPLQGCGDFDTDLLISYRCTRATPPCAQHWGYRENEPGPCPRDAHILADLSMEATPPPQVGTFALRGRRIRLFLTGFYLPSWPLPLVLVTN